MKRITFWFLSTLSVVVLLFGYDGSTSATTSTTSPPAAISSTTPGTTTGSSSGTSSGSSSSNGSSGSGSGTTKKVTGSVASTQWGPVQVQLTVSSGKITAVTVLQQPSGNPKDTEINDRALPILTQETTSAQSADIDMVSGATVTSNGYLESLQSAIDKAGL